MSGNGSANESENMDLSFEYDDGLSDGDERIEDELEEGNKVSSDDLRDIATKHLLKDQNQLHAGEEEARTVVKLNGVCASSSALYITDHFNRSVKRIQRKQPAQASKSGELEMHVTERFGAKQTQFVGGCALCNDEKLLVCTAGTSRLLVLDARTGEERQRLAISRAQREFHDSSSYIFETADHELLVAYRDTDVVFELRMDDASQRYELAVDSEPAGGKASEEAAGCSSDSSTSRSVKKSVKLQLCKAKKPVPEPAQSRLASVRLVEHQVVHSVRKRLLAFAYSRSLCYTVCVYTTHEAEICDRQFALAESVCLPARNAPEWQPNACLFVESVRTPFILFAMRAGPICAFTLEGRFAYRLVDDLSVTCWCAVNLAPPDAHDGKKTCREYFELLVFGFEKRKVETGQCAFGESQKLFALDWSV